MGSHGEALCVRVRMRFADGKQVVDYAVALGAERLVRDGIGLECDEAKGFKQLRTGLSGSGRFSDHGRHAGGLARGLGSLRSCSWAPADARRALRPEAPQAAPPFFIDTTRRTPIMRFFRNSFCDNG